MLFFISEQHSKLVLKYIAISAASYVFWIKYVTTAYPKKPRSNVSSNLHLFSRISESSKYWAQVDKLQEKFTCV